MGWVGSYPQFFDALDRVIGRDPVTTVHGHGPVYGIEAVRNEQARFHHVLDESRKYFEAGLTSGEAAERIELRPYGEWKAPARLVINVERAYREFRNELAGAPWEAPRVFDGMYHLAKAKGILRSRKASSTLSRWPVRPTLRKSRGG